MRKTMIAIAAAGALGAATVAAAAMSAAEVVRQWRTAVVDLRRRAAILAAPIWAGPAARLISPGLLQAISPAQAVISRPEVLTATTVDASEEASDLAASM